MTRYLEDHDTSGLDIRIMPVAEAARFWQENFYQPFEEQGAAAGVLLTARHRTAGPRAWPLADPGPAAPAARPGRDHASPRG